MRFRMLLALLVGLPVLAVSGQEPNQDKDRKVRAPGPPEVMDIH